MHVAKEPHGFVITTQDFLPVPADEFERVLLAPSSIAAWNHLILTEPERGTVPIDVGDPMEFIVRIGPLAFDYVMIVASRVPGASYTQRTTKGFVDVTIEYSWRTRGLGTEVTVEAHYRQTGSLWWKTPLTRMVACRSVRRASRNMRNMFSPRRAQLT